MSDERRERILGRLHPPGQSVLEADRLGRVCAEVTGSTGAGLMLMSGDVPQGSVGTTDEVSRIIEDLQYSLGEGPCIDAYHQGRPVIEADLASPAKTRWVAFTPPALQAGVRAIFGYPLQVGTVRLGALNLYNDRAGDLTVDQHADAVTMSEVAAQAILIMQAGAPSGTLATELERGSDFRYVVHQASGMVAAQLDTSVAQALLRMRGHAFANNTTLTEVAEDVVDRRLRFSPEPDTGPTTA